MSIKSDTQGFDISSKKVAVIGLGGLGCNCCVHLVGAGIGNIYICDFDTISESNLNRQFVYRASDIGRKKTVMMSDFLTKYNTDCKVHSIDKKIESENDLDFAKDCDLIVLALDNVKTRRIANTFCINNQIPLVNGGINGFFGNSYLFLPKTTPCLDCAGMLNESVGLKNISCTAGIIGAQMVSISIKYLIGDNSIAGKLFVLDNEEINALKIKPSEKCNCRKEEL
ncbi:MAG: ThiF family adenylyltransferase [Clostridia bacterium]|nr:ThiF family adenylyltransferase [Clostridia bacterium]